MNYNETIKFLYDHLPFYQKIGNQAFKKGLDNIEELCNKLGNPQDAFKIVHIGGTNGKGSSAHSIASICKENGLKTGLYTSPHLLDFRERIRVDGKKISKYYITNFIKNNLTLINKINPSFFEVTLALAFGYFRKQRIKLAIIEVGLGGRLDSTNIVNPLITLITNIGLDHQEILGSSLRKIAIEKSGIIKKNSLTIIGEKQNELVDIFNKKASHFNSKLFYASDIVKINKNEKWNNEFKIQILLFNKIYTNKIEVKSNYYIKNIPGIVLVSYYILEYYKIKSSNPFVGLSKVKKNTGLIGRWEILSNKPMIICDICHNVNAFREILIEINKIKFNKLYFIIGGVKTKNWKKITSILPSRYIYIVCRPKSPRAIKTNSLAKYLKNNNLNYKVIDNASMSLNYAKSLAKSDDLIFIGGSIFLVSEILNRWEKEN